MNANRAKALAAGAAALLLMASAPAIAQVAQKEFVGSETCAKCHPGEYRTWKASTHAQMIRPMKEGLLKDAGENWAKDPKGGAGPATGNIDKQPRTMDDVVYVVGSRWKQRFLVTNAATGGHQFMNRQWNTVHRQWENYGQSNDWETQCATCHTTGYRVLAQDEKTGAVTKWSFSEMNVGCEACHGPGAAHVSAKGKKPIFNPAKASNAEASKICGYCHIRLENYQFRTIQGRPAEFLPHPTIGQSYKAGQDDWTKWYPEKVLLVGIQPEDKIQNYPKTDLENGFWFDAQSEKSGLYDARKHHQQYQEYLQSAHAKKDILSCSSCHSSHATVERASVDSRATCKGCHKDRYDWEKIMPGTGSTAQNLFVRTHTFNKDQARAQTPTITGRPEPAYFHKK